ncbi:hypothetical protein PV11_07771 [Exophiala sideris]|uniref:Deacetylase sirtuin-type domain-containing protein n=1 Tax=Exophiala sideris TaxID=1016849 RepID=A0A0D1YGZ6_9EURO|nr:hypothetical protein PV11_07771 [Exophiala sideris]
MGLRELTIKDERPLQEVADILAGSHKVLLVTGAGISTSCGIPDFRSKDGLYNIIPEQALLTPPPSRPSTPSRCALANDEDFPSSQSSNSSRSSQRSSASPSSKLRGQDLFDSRVFQNAASTTMFYQFIASLRQRIRDEVRSTSTTHKFIRVLRDGGRLMRCYTQNIDGLEAREGLVTDLSRGKGNKRRFMKKHYEVPRPAHTAGTDFDGGCEVVQLHGDLEKLRCTMCAKQMDWTDEETEIYLEGAAPSCQSCRVKSEERQASGKRGLAVGSLRPNIVLYGEDHPSNTLLTPLIPFDAICQPEVLVIMGTSLKVFGLQKIVREFAKAVHSQKNGKGRVIFVNRTRPAETTWDGVIDDFVAMDCDEWVEDVRRRRPDIWLRQGDLDLKVTKSSQAKRKRKSMDDESDAEKRPIKKTKVTVEIPKAASSNPKIVPSTPSGNRMSQQRYKLPPNYPGRAILSPLAQARRPPVSPLSSPVRGDNYQTQLTPVQRGTPKTPAFSPFTPGVLSGSKLSIEVFHDEEEENINANEAVVEESDLETEPAPAPSETDTQDKKHWTAYTPPVSNFVAKVWQRLPGRRVLPYSKHLDEIGELAKDLEDDDVIDVETPSKGPRGRIIDVLAGE